MSSERSVTGWLRQLEAGNEQAANQLWHRYFHRLVALARKKLRPNARRVADEEDIALSVLRCLFDGAARGQFSAMANRDDLWRLLTTIASHKAVDHARHERQKKRGGGRVGGGAVLERHARAASNQLADRLPSPELFAILAEEHHRLMSLLGDDTLRRIAHWNVSQYICR